MPAPSAPSTPARSWGRARAAAPSCAPEVSARVVREGEPIAPSHGFHGYDWMVASILRHGQIYADHERPEAAP